MTKGLVLIVDDDAAIVDLMEIALKERGYRVVSASGQRALPMARYLHPDVILLDLHMPGMSGTEISAYLKADPATASIPVVAMSALHSLEEVTCALRCEAHLPKPFTLARLLDTVARWAPEPAVAAAQPVAAGV